MSTIENIVKSLAYATEHNQGLHLTHEEVPALNARIAELEAELKITDELLKEATETIGYEVLQRYVCKNRVTKAKIEMVRIKYLVNGKDVGRRVYLICLDHNETRHCQSKTEALYQMRQPWVWCDECAKIHLATEWQNMLNATNKQPVDYW